MWLFFLFFFQSGLVLFLWMAWFSCRTLFHSDIVGFPTEANMLCSPALWGWNPTPSWSLRAASAHTCLAQDIDINKLPHIIAGPLQLCVGLLTDYVSHSCGTFSKRKSFSFFGESCLSYRHVPFLSLASSIDWPLLNVSWLLLLLKRPLL